MTDSQLTEGAVTHHHSTQGLDAMRDRSQLQWCYVDCPTCLAARGTEVAGRIFTIPAHR